MLFNSLEFIFLFLPVTLGGFFLLGSWGKMRMALAWLVAASLFFYGWWNPAYLLLIASSIGVNFTLGVRLARTFPAEGPAGEGLAGGGRKRLMILGVAFNLALLGYFKYANFFVDSLNLLTGSEIHLSRIILPLAISFFTFQQIAYLVDSYRGETEEYRFLHYCLFVTFFPQLIAGPIVHHREMLPQFARAAIYQLSRPDLTVGLTIFLLGLFKKVAIADSVALFANPVFDGVAAGGAVTILEAWTGVLAYTFQLYFDFSGYSDMAIGLGRMFGIRLPLNFHSPYRASSIVEFWRWWHITLSRFLRDYLYIPLGGNRKGRVRRYVNLMLTMLLGGLWHGAGWIFVAWGGLHGFYLVVNHVWRAVTARLRWGWTETSRLWKVAATGLTFLAVVFAWVPFRAENMTVTWRLWRAMLGFEGFQFSPTYLATLQDIRGRLIELGWVMSGGLRTPDPHLALVWIGVHHQALIWLVTLTVIAFVFPNTQEWLHRVEPALERVKGLDQSPGGRGGWWGRKWADRWSWRPGLASGVVMGLLLFLTFKSYFRLEVSEFLYFNF